MSEWHQQRPRSSEKLRFVIVTFWASADWNKLELDELECAIKSDVGEQNSRRVEPAALMPCGTVDFHGHRSSMTKKTVRMASLPRRQRRPESETATGRRRNRWGVVSGHPGSSDLEESTVIRADSRCLCECRETCRFYERFPPSGSWTVSDLSDLWLNMLAKMV